MTTDNVRLNQAKNQEGELIRADVDADGALHQAVKLEFGKDGEIFPVTDEEPLPVISPKVEDKLDLILAALTSLCRMVAEATDSSEDL